MLSKEQRRKNQAINYTKQMNKSKAQVYKHYGNRCACCGEKCITIQGGQRGRNTGGK